MRLGGVGRIIQVAGGEAAGAILGGAGDGGDQSRHIADRIAEDIDQFREAMANIVDAVAALDADTGALAGQVVADEKWRWVHEGLRYSRAT